MRDRDWRLPLAATLFLWTLGCGGDGLDGPQRSAFDGIGEVQIAVERGDITLFGSNSAARVVLDRWSGPAEDFELLEERKEGNALIVNARCVLPGQCQTRHDLALDEGGRWDVHTGDGAVEIIKAAGPVRAVVERGSLRGARLTSDSVDIHIVRGTVRLQFDQPPANLRLRIDSGDAIVVLPEQRYRCEFDRHSENIGLNGMHCHDLVSDTIRLEPSNAKVRFEIQSPDR